MLVAFGIDVMLIILCTSNRLRLTDIREGEFMAALAFCIDTGRRDLENARMGAIRTDKKSGKDEIVAPCDNDLEEGKPPVRYPTTFPRRVPMSLPLTTFSFSSSGAVLPLHSRRI
jgi:hypothetical protein